MTWHTTHVRKRLPDSALLLATAIALGAVALGGVWLLRHDGSGPTRTATAAPQHASADGPREVRTGQERGGFAERLDDLGYGRQPPPPSVVDPVDDAASCDACRQIAGAGAVSGISDQEMYSRWLADQWMAP